MCRLRITTDSLSHTLTSTIPVICCIKNWLYWMDASCYILGMHRSNVCELAQNSFQGSTLSVVCDRGIAV